MVSYLIVRLALGQGAYQYERLKSFGDPNASGGHPNGLIQARDGAFYGTTSYGGANNAGTVFRINRDGSGYRTLHSFTGTDGDGSNPGAALVEGQDGVLYGTTGRGGNGSGGIVFRINKDGSEYKVVHSFGGDSHNIWSEWNPNSPLLEGSDGVLYGTTSTGGVFRIGRTGESYGVLLGNVGSYPSGLIEGRDGFLYGRSYHGGEKGFGMIFKIGKDGNGFRVLHSFMGGKDDGQYGAGELLEASDGFLYGTTYWGGADGDGTVFRLNTQGGEYTLLRSGAVGAPEHTRLSEGRDGTLYGLSLWGGSQGNGALFKLNKDGSGYSVLISFHTDGGEVAPTGSLVLDSAGALIGTTQFDGVHRAGTVFQVDTQGNGFQILFDFDGGRADQGQSPSAELLLSHDGRLYGTTTDSGGNGSGTVFRLNRDGSGFGVLHIFLGQYVTIGGYEQHGLIEGSDDALYGTTELGGGAGQGSAFKLNKDGSGFRVLHDFTSGEHPAAGVLEGTDGALYGTTSTGDSDASGGTVFKLSTDGIGYTVLHRFALSSDDGSGPRAGLIEGSDGAFYGTTRGGGAFDHGTVFSLDGYGNHYRVVYSFTSDDSRRTALLEGSDHALYGVDVGGVFKVNKDGSGFKLVHTFAEGESAGALSKGFGQTLYGVGGSNGMSTLFRLSEDGTGFMVLHTFAGPDGAAPLGAMSLSSDGVLYGTTAYGGDMTFGVVFALHPQPVLLPLVLANTSIQVRLSSTPGASYQLQHAPALNGPWITLTNVVVPSSGVAEFMDVSTARRTDFYRAFGP
jgi:uncharacterized repeat protein (TIGR03803 family)